MDLRMLLLSFSPYMRVGIASAPIFVSLAARLLMGNHRALPALLMGSATWLAMNIMVSLPA
jgi:hypothetical protein